VDRTKMLLDDIFNNEAKTIISFTVHSGTVHALYTATQHRDIWVATGAVVPILIKAELVDHGNKLREVEIYDSGLPVGPRTRRSLPIPLSSLSGRCYGICTFTTHPVQGKKHVAVLPGGGGRVYRLEVTWDLYAISRFIMECSF